MKTVRYYIALIAVAGILSVPVRGRMESPSLSERPFPVGRPHPALVGIGGFRVVLLRSGFDPIADGLDWTQLTAGVTSKLGQANIRLISETAYSILNSPELRVHVNLLKLDDSQLYVFRIQTSVARSVCLRAQKKPFFKADLWTLKPAFEAVSIDDMPARITDVVLGQIKALIQAYEIANPQGKPVSDSRMNKIGSTAIPEPK